MQTQKKRINRQRTRRLWRVTNKVKRHTTRPRLAVFRSLKHMYAQIVDDVQGRTLVAVSTLDKEVRGQIKYGGNKAAAAAVGTALAKLAVAVGVKEVAFDRRLYRYHGRVAELADAARKGGLQF